MGIGLADKMNG